MDISTRSGADPFRSRRNPLCASVSLFSSILLSLLLRAAPPAMAQCVDHWLPGAGFPGTDGPVSVTVPWDPDADGSAAELLVAGGGFRIAGTTLAKGIAVWDGEHWAALGSSFDDGFARALAVHKGQLVAGGSFTSSGGTSVGGIARWDGKAWQPMGAGFNAGVRALATFAGELYAGGEFTTSGGSSLAYIARWNGSTWEPVGSGVNNWVRVLTIYNGELVAGGSFTTAGGIDVQYIARWNGDNWARLGTTSYGVTNPVHSLSAYNGKLAVGGSFSYAANIPARAIATWDGASWEPLGSGMQSTSLGTGIVYGATQWNDNLYVTGSFAYAGGVAAYGLARWDGAAWGTVGDAASVGNGSSLAVYNGELVLGAQFLPDGDISAHGIARWNGTDWWSLGSGWEDLVHAVADYRGEMVAAGDFDVTPDGRIAHKIARWDGKQWQPLGAGMDDRVHALTVFDENLVAGGTFWLADGAPCDYVARWDGHSWTPLGDGTDLQVAALAVYRGELIAGGRAFRGGTCVHRWNGMSWEPVGHLNWTGPLPDVWVWAMSVWGDKLVVGGDFDFGGNAQRLLYWDGAQWRTLGLGSESIVRALAVYKGDLMAVRGNSSLHWNVNRWNGMAWVQLGVGVEYFEGALTVYNGKLVAAGTFSGPTTLDFGGIGAWDGVSWVGMGDPSRSAPLAAVTTLGGYDGSLVAGGSYFSADGRVSAYMSRWGSGFAFGDYDCNGAVDEEDYGQVYACMGGPGQFYPAGCVRADHDGDQDLDLHDFHRFQNGFGPKE